MREPKNQMLGTMEPPLMQLSVKYISIGTYSYKITKIAIQRKHCTQDDYVHFP